ncbi:pemK-like family protein [Exiguobacterium sp. S17]|nr:pemK-like family protein [Exiguobacterium sp. S17]
MSSPSVKHERPLVGQIGYFDFEPSAGSEIQKRRPALVISQNDFNRTGFCIVCPITHTEKPLFVRIPDDLPVNGFINVVQAKSIDWKARRWKATTNCPPAVVEQVQEIVAVAILGECSITRV